MHPFNTHSSSETQQIAKGLAKKLLNTGGIVALYGDLGAGKTTFSQGFAKALGIVDRVISPTFVLLRQYPVPNTDKIFYHFDLYRLETADDLKMIGFLEIINNPENLVLIEWAEKAENLLPKTTIRITIERKGENQRIVSIDPQLL